MRVWETRPSADTPSDVHWRRFYFQLTCVHSALDASGTSDRVHQLVCFWYHFNITGTVVKPMQKSTGKWEIRHHVKSYPLKYHLETLHTSLCRRGFPPRKFCVNRYNAGFSPNRRIITILLLIWLFCTVYVLTVLSCPYLFSTSCTQVEPLNRFSRFMAQTMCFRARMILG